MKWRVMAVMSFDDEGKARGLWRAIQAIQSASMRLSSDHANIHKCYHDEEPTKPCEIIEELS